MNRFKSWIWAISLFSIVAVIILLPQINNQFLIIGSDMTFHYNRFYDLAQQITNKHFNYYQSLYGFEGSGRIVNAIYGYDMAFFNAILLLLTKSWLKFQLLSSFLCLVIAGTSMFSLLRKLNITYFFCLAGSILYITTIPFYYFLTDIGFSGWGSALLPFIFIPCVDVIQNSKKPINPIFLGTSVAILVNTHILTSILAILAIIPFYIIGFINSNKKLYFIRELILSIIIFIILSLNTIIAYIEVFFSNSILNPYIPDSFIKYSTKLTISQEYTKYNLGLLFGLIFIFQILYTIINYRKIDLISRLFTIVGCVFLFLSSPLMPWDMLIKTLPELTIIQFPYRFSFISYVLILASFMKTLNNLSFEKSIKISQKNMKLIVSALCIFSVSQMSVIVVRNAIKWVEDPISMGNNRGSLLVTADDKIRNNMRSPDLHKLFETIQKGSPDYLPLKENITSEIAYKEKEPYKKVITELFQNQDGFNREILDDGRIQITFDSNDFGTDKIILPAVAYSHSTIELNGEMLSSNQYDVTDIGALIIEPSIEQNTVVVGYVPNIDMSYVLLIKLIGIFGVMGYYLYYLVKTSRLKN